MIWSNEPRVVVTIHGIQTHGEWQKNITPYLARCGLIPYHIHYGWFSVLRFLWPFSREKQVQRVRKELRDLVDRLGARRISVIAHSFGTYLAMEALVRDNGALLYDRVVLTGSILASDFDWNRVMTINKWVNAVRNERTTDDQVVTFARIVSNNYSRWLLRLKAGDSGRNPFLVQPATLLDDQIGGGHSETHNPLKFQRWARFIAYPCLSEDIRKKVVTEMQALRQSAASILETDPARIRINLFAPIANALRIVPGAIDNMTYAPEFELEIQPNHGATGNAYTSGNPCIVVKRGQTWSGNHLPGAELAKINPDLKWVISLPVKSAVRGTVVGVINIDGLDNIPAKLDKADSEDCQATILALHAGMLQRFQPCLDVAFRGDELPQLEA